MGSQNSLHINEQNQFPGQRGQDGSQGGFASGSILDQFEQLQMYSKSGQLTPEQAAQLHAAQQLQMMQGQKPMAQQTAPTRSRGPPAARNMPSSDGSSDGVHATPMFNQVTEQNIMKLSKQYQVNIDPKGGSYIESSNSGSDFTLHLWERIKANQQRALKEQQQAQAHQVNPNTQNLGVNLQQNQQNAQSQQQLQNLFQQMQNMTPQQQQEYLHQLLAQQQNMQLLQNQHVQKQAGQPNSHDQQLVNMIQEQIAQQLTQHQNQAQFMQNIGQIQQQFAQLNPQQQQLLLEQHYDKLPLNQQQAILQMILQSQNQKQSLDGQQLDQNLFNNPVAMQMLSQHLMQQQNAPGTQAGANPQAQFNQANLGGQGQANAAGGFVQQPQIQMQSEIMQPGFGGMMQPTQLKAGGPDQSLQQQQQLQAQMQSNDQLNVNNFVNQQTMSPTDPQMMPDLSGGGILGGQGQNANFLQQQQLSQFQLQHVQTNFMSKVEHIFQWSFGGEVVEIMGHFNNWQGERMQKIEPGDNLKTFGVTQQSLRMNQPPPTHYFVKFLDPQKCMYKFRVDGNWRYAPDQEITRDERGNENNVIDLTNAKTIGHFLQENKQYQQQLTPQEQYQQQVALLRHNQYQMLIQQMQQQMILPSSLSSIQHQQLAAAALAQTIPQFNAPTQSTAQTPQTAASLDSQAQAALKQILQQQQLQQMQGVANQPVNQQQQAQSQSKSDEVPQNQGVQQPQSAVGTQSQNSGNQPRSGNQVSTGAAPGDIDNMPQENIYHQNLPEETEEQMQDPQLLPIHFSYNFMERDQIPLHNEKYSRMNNEHQKQTEVIQKGFFDKTLPAPSHVILNHINSWDVMLPLDHENTEQVVSDQETVTQGQATAPTVASTQNKPISAGNGMTCITMPQRLNRSKFMTIVYYKPNKI